MVLTSSLKTALCLGALLLLLLGGEEVSAHPTGKGKGKGKGGKSKSHGAGSQGGAAAAGNAKAIYVSSNNQQNSVAALALGADGLIARGSVTPTGGAGMNGIDGANNQSAAPDSLFTQGALTVAGNSLFVVNAGSNTVSMFAISTQDPTSLTPIGQPAPIPAEFPSTVAASAVHNLVCVGATGAKAGVSCAAFSPTQGIGAMDGLREFDLGQTTPPVGPTNTVSHVFFSGDQNTLFATVKGDGKANKGFLAAFAVTPAAGQCGQGQGQSGAAAAAAVSTQAVNSSPDGTAVLFGSAPIPGTASDILATDASFGAAVLSVDPASLKATTKARAAIADQKATCWVSFSPATGTAFVTDVKFNRLVEVSKEGQLTGQIIDLSANGQSDLTDTRAAGDFVYGLSAGNGSLPAAVTVVDVVRGRQAQNFRLDSFGLGPNSMGVAIL